MTAPVWAPVWALGTMTGTSGDGMVDLALLQTDGHRVTSFGPWTLSPYAPTVTALIAEATQAALAWNFEGPEPAIFQTAEHALTQGHATAIQAFLTAQGIPPAQVTILGFHGQTVLHRPPRPGIPGRTRQLGDGPLLARLTGIATAYDFRTKDVAAGGQGAPLAAAYHAALLDGPTVPPHAAVLNLGGVANISARTPHGMVAFDTGPANAPLNDWAARHTGTPMDRDGALARAGHVDEPRLAQLLKHPHFAAPYPKSLDRSAFQASMADGLTPANGAATLTAFTAATVGRGLDLLPQRPRYLVVCGGGRRNPAMMEALQSRAQVTPLQAEAMGWRGDAIEAECFAFLAVRVLQGQPISFPGTTGVPAPMTGGRLAQPP